MDRPRTSRRPRRRLLWLVVAVAAALGVTVGLRRLGGAAPVVSRDTVLIDTVRRGPMVRQVQAPGTLVATDVRWITTETAARVERLLVQAGDEVAADTVLVELSNPDVELRALESRPATWTRGTATW